MNPEVAVLATGLHLQAGVKNIFIAGNLANKPLLQKTDTGRVFTYLILTTNRFSYNRGHWDKATCWHSVLVWGRDAESCAQHLQKGFPLAIEGAFTKEHLIAEKVHFLGLRNIVEDSLIAPKKGMED